MYKVRKVTVSLIATLLILKTKEYLQGENFIFNPIFLKELAVDLSENITCSSGFFCGGNQKAWQLWLLMAGGSCTNILQDYILNNQPIFKHCRVWGVGDFSLFFMGNMEKVRICKGQWYHFRNQFMVSLKQTSRYANSHICQLILLAIYSSPAKVSVLRNPWLWITGTF